MRLRVLAFGLMLTLAVPATAQSGNQPKAEARMLTGRFGGDAPFQIERRGFSFPVIEYVEPNGTLQLRRGIVAGKTIAPNTLLGVGFFETAPRSRPRISDPANPASQKRPKRAAAIGLSLGF